MTPAAEATTHLVKRLSIPLETSVPTSRKQESGIWIAMNQVAGKPHSSKLGFAITSG
jgi:hypothetical protein